MGTTPRKATQSATRAKAKIVSFDDAKRKSASKPSGDAKTRPLAGPSAAVSKSASVKASAKPGAKSKALSRSVPTRPLEPNPEAKPKVRTTAKKAAKATGSKGDNPAKRALSRKKSRKDITIARGAEREGALSMRTEEEIEAEARAEEESRKQEKRKNSKVAAASDKMKAKHRERKRARNKAKAEKKFEAAYGGDKGSAKSGAQAAPAEGAPRAAIYEGKMGAKHKKSAKLQAKAAGHAIKSAATGFSLPTGKLPDIPAKVSRVLASVAVVAVCAFMLYGPAQNYYQQMRETDRLQAEYAAVAARNNTLQSTIDSLSSDEGIEDKAHTDLGYIKKGEHTATVKGANIIDTTEFSSNVAPGSVSAPETWYSPVLDVLFGYSS